MLNETKIIADKILSKRFMFHKESNTFTAESSELPMGFNPMSQIWNDSCDVGFIMISSSSGKEIIFTHAHTHRKDGDIHYHTFTAVPSLNKGIISERIFVNIYND